MGIINEGVPTEVVTLNWISTTYLTVCRLFARELRQWENDGDPLTAWTNYLTWLDEKGLGTTGSIDRVYIDAIQKCLRYFNATPEYHNEVRLARIYISAVSLRVCV